MIAFLSRFVIAGKRPNTLTSWMRWNRDRCDADVVVVIGLRQLMTKTFTVNVWTRLTTVSNEWWIDGDPDDVVPRWHGGLSVAAIQNEVLPGKRKSISVSPAGRDPLITGNTYCAAVSEFSFTRWNTTYRNRIWIRVEHTEAALRRTPNLACPRIDKFVKCIVAEVEMVMTRRKFKEPIVRGKVLVWIANEEVFVSGVWRHYSKTHQPP